MELHRLLPAQPSSAGAARHFAEDALRQYRQEALTDVTTLLVSELVTNALLHAGSQIGVRVRMTDSVLRVEVHDASPVLPLARSYDDDATTGRGLEMVELLAADWGVEPLPRGKVVWFEIPAAGADAGGQPATAHTAPSRRSSPVRRAVRANETSLRTVQLLAAPVRLCRAMQQHVDALLRERILMGLGNEQHGTSSEETAAAGLVADLTAQLQPELDGAADSGVATVDVTLRLPTGALPASRELGAHLDEADDLARRGALLIPAALPEIRACRHWLLHEVGAQLAGAAPTAWLQYAAADHPSRDLWTLVEHTPILDQLGDAVLVADDENRIVHANPAVERLLGWSRADLIGRRLTTIVPERLREAHVAGYSRYLVTSQPRLLGRPVRLPARRRDGSEVPIELLLTTFRSPDGRPAFVGALRDLRERNMQDAQEPPAITAVRVLHDLVASLTVEAHPTPKEVAHTLLLGLGRGMQWQVGAVWTQDANGDLRCASTWQDDSLRFEAFQRHTERLRLAPGDGLPGRAWTSRGASWISDVAADAGYVRGAVALEHGLRSGFAFPLVSGSAVMAVVELYSTRTLDVDPALLAVLETAGRVADALAERS